MRKSKINLLRIISAKTDKTFICRTVTATKVADTSNKHTVLHVLLFLKPFPPRTVIIHYYRFQKMVSFRETNRLVGLVVKASASTAADLGVRFPACSRIFPGRIIAVT